MALAEVLSWAQSLPRSDQLRLIEELAAGLRRPEADPPHIEPGRDYPVWSPDTAFAAAGALLAALGPAGDAP